MVQDAYTNSGKIEYCCTDLECEGQVRVSRNIGEQYSKLFSADSLYDLFNLKPLEFNLILKFSRLLPFIRFTMGGVLSTH